MQAFVKRHGESGDMVVVAAYSDETVVPSGSHPDCVLMVLPATAFSVDANTGMTVLKSNWKSNSGIAVNGEARRRIVEVFDDTAQRNALADSVNSITKYGSDPNLWPVDAKARKAISDQGWNYIKGVRQRSNALAASVPDDPSDSKHWPTVVKKIKV